MHRKCKDIDMDQTLTIGKLAKAAQVGVETVRYYQQRSLLPKPQGTGGVRRYSLALVERIRFIKRAQELGFSLDEIASLLALEDGTDREAIRSLTTSRLVQVEAKLADLERMRDSLRVLVSACEHTDHDWPCPIIASLAGDRQ